MDIAKSYGFRGVTMTLLITGDARQQSRFIDWATALGGEVTATNRGSELTVESYHKQG